MILFKNFHPRHQTRYWGTKLVSCFFRQSHPNFILLSLLRRKQGKYSDDHKNHDNPQLPIRIGRKSFQQYRFIKAYQLIIPNLGRVTHIYLYISAILVQFTTIFHKISKGINPCFSIQLNIAIISYLTLSIHNNNRNGVITLHHVQHQRKISRLISMTQYA